MVSFRPDGSPHESFDVSTTCLDVDKMRSMGTSEAEEDENPC